MKINKRRLASLSFEVAYYGAFVFFLWWISTRNTHPPLRPLFWHTLMRICNATAYATGRVAIQAELMYGAAIESVRQ